MIPCLPRINTRVDSRGSACYGVHVSQPTTPDIADSVARAFGARAVDPLLEESRSGKPSAILYFGAVYETLGRLDALAAMYVAARSRDIYGVRATRLLLRWGRRARISLPLLLET